MKAKEILPPNNKLERAAKLRQIAANTAQAAMTTAPGYEAIVLGAAEVLNKMAESAERKAKLESSEPPVAVLSPDATLDELRTARRRQAVRRGRDTYLPSWSDVAMALPTAFLRTALFASSQNVQAHSARVLEGDQGSLVAGKEIASLSNLTLTLSGYELCQFDRQVYATCLDYYRERPLVPEESQQHIATSFYEFTKRMKHSYGLSTHRAIRASLLRLSLTQLRLRYNGWNIEVPKLLTVSFKDGSIGGEFKASDLISLRVTETVAELFGRGGWTAVDKEAVTYDGLKGWLASFYAGHSAAVFLPVNSLHKISGYSSHIRNFRKSLICALDKLQDEATPAGCRISGYQFTKDMNHIKVVRSAWTTESK